MSSSHLPESGPEREIFLKALKLFSDECVPPELIAECPFSIDLPSGGRGCGEECLDLLDRYGMPGSTGGIPMGIPEVAAHPMGRPKRTKRRISSAKPFDAGEVFYRDSDDTDPSNWGTISLLYGLKTTYLPTPNALLDPHRTEKLDAISSELRRRHFDVDELLRYGLRLRMASALAMATVLPGLIAAQPPQTNGEDESAQESELLAQSPLGWPELVDAYAALKDPLPPGSSEVSVAAHRLFVVLTNEFFARLELWAATASIDDLINWRPPTIDEFLTYDLANESAIKARSRRPLWMMDRFTETYLKDWNTDSLRIEWRYQQGSEEPPCLRREMSGRKIDVNDLARALAEATAYPVSGKLLEIKIAAIRLLISGRRKTAAAMFDAARQDNWDDSELQNNYGFCTLPDDPSEALKALELAVKLGFTKTVNICNRVMALFMLGRNATALEVAEQAIERWDELETEPSYLWDFRTSEPELLTRAHPRSYLLDLATYVADESGNELVAARWNDRKSRLERGAGG